jgi:phosphatidylglycerol---prolipoprotein diacylglyceryl transferase
MFTSPGSIAFSLGSLSVHWYGLIIGLGIIGAMLYSAQEFKRRNLSPDLIYDMGFWLVISGIVGARLYYVIFQWSLYKSNILSAFAIWEGGLAIHGGIIGGVLALYFYARHKKINWLMTADVLAPGLLFAQALGRWGNFFNSEAFGGPTDLPWKLYIPEAARPTGFENIEYFHPTFLYESLWNITGVVLLVILMRKLYGQKKKTPYGYIFLSYFIYYSIGRFFIEGLRLDSLYFGQLRAAQIASLALISLGIVGIIFINKQSKSTKSN